MEKENKISQLSNIEKRKTLIASLSSILPNLNDLSDLDFKKVVKSLALDNLKEQLKKENQKANFDLQDCLNTFLNQYKSKFTKSTYKNSLNVFIQWIQDNNLNPIDINVMQADKFVAFINSLDKTNNYKASILNSVSSFYSYLFRWSFIERQPFLNCKKPKLSKYNKTSEKVPTKEDLESVFFLIDEKINDKNKKVSLGGKKLKASVLILLNNGLRIGSLDTMTIKKDGAFTCETKGKLQKGKLDFESLEYLKDAFGFTQGNLNEIIKSNSLLNFFKRNKFSFSSHSFRHYFAINHYTKHKDIYKLSRLLNHNDIGITGTYLSSLDIDLETK